MAKDISDMTTAELKAEYGAIMRRSQASSPMAFTAKVKASLPHSGKDSTPATFVATACRVRFMCKRCAGTGAFITGSHNGKPVGPGGECFRCRGKGKQSDKDVRRNDYYDAHYMGGGAM